jgi:hypothetical protein
MRWGDVLSIGEWGVVDGFCGAGIFESVGVGYDLGGFWWMDGSVCDNAGK